MPDWTEHLRPRLALLRLSPAREAEIIEVARLRSYFNAQRSAAACAGM